MNLLEEGKKIKLQFTKRGGLLPVVVQEYSTGQIIMMGSINEEAYQKTLDTKMATFWSTSRNELWTKGETSGDFLSIKEILIDCDQDAVVYQVELEGNGACHTVGKEGNTRKGCFYRKINFEKLDLQFIEGME